SNNTKIHQPSPGRPNGNNARAPQGRGEAGQKEQAPAANRQRRPRCSRVVLLSTDPTSPGSGPLPPKLALGTRVALTRPDFGGRQVKIKGHFSFTGTPGSGRTPGRGWDVLILASLIGLMALARAGAGAPLDAYRVRPC